VASRLFLLSTIIVFHCLLDGSTRSIPHTEPSDLAAIFPTQYYRSRGVHQIQAVPVAQKMVLTVVLVHGPTLSRPSPTLHPDGHHAYHANE
jgi:hypothetical protein